MEQIQRMIQESKLCEAINTVNEHIEGFIIGDIFEIYEIGEDSDVFYERYETCSDAKLSHIHDFAIRKHNGKKGYTHKCLIKVGHKKHMDIAFYDGEYHLICREVGERPVGGMRATTVSETMQIISQHMDLSEYGIDIEKLVKNVVVDEDYEDYTSSTLNKLLSLCDVIDEYSDTIDYYIDITNDFCSVYSAINLSKNGEHVSCQLNDDKFRFFKRITKNGEHTFVEKYATIDNAIEIIEEMFKVDDLHENDDDEMVDVDIEL